MQRDPALLQGEVSHGPPGTEGDEDRSRRAWGKVYLATGFGPSIRGPTLYHLNSAIHFAALGSSEEVRK